MRVTREMCAFDGEIFPLRYHSTCYAYGKTLLCCEYFLLGKDMTFVEGVWKTSYRGEIKIAIRMSLL